MKNFTLSPEAFERYMDASVELFMECYADTISIDSDAAAQEQDSPRLHKKCASLVKAFHRRKKLLRAAKGAFRITKAAAVLVILCMSLSSVLFVTVEAVRTPIMNFYIKEHEGNWELSNTPFGTDPNNLDHISKGSFNEQDPLGELLSDEFYLDSAEGNLNDGLYAVYYNNDGKHISLHCDITEGKLGINTENAKVERFRVSDYDAIFVVRNNVHNPMLVWYNSDIDRFFMLHSDYFSKEQLIDMAEILNFLMVQ